MSLFDDLLGRILSPRDGDVATRSETHTLADTGWWMKLTGHETAAGETVSDTSAMGLTAVFRAVQVIAGTIASLPLHTYREREDGYRERVPSVFDNPSGVPHVTPYQWVEGIVVNRLLHGEAFIHPVRNGGDAIAALQPIHPLAVSVESDPSRLFGRIYTITTAQGQRRMTELELVQTMGVSLDGLRGLGPIAACRNAIGSGIAADKAAGRMYSNGLLLGGVMSIPSDYKKEQAEEFQADLQRRLGGTSRAGDIAVINADVNFSPWTMNAADAQFIESRGFQVEEVARLFGVPKVLLAEDGASTWGSGIGELIRGMQKFTFAPLTSSLEQDFSTLLPPGEFCEFDYAGLLQPDHSQVIANMAAELAAGTLTQNEARRILNRPPITPQEANV